MKRKVLCALLACILLLSLMPTALAASSEAEEAANALYELGLFKGTGTDQNGDPIFELDRAPTRHEAVTMLVRLLGKEDEALAGNWNIPFTDVADWAKPYVGYAYANGLTTGTSATTFGGTATVTASQYITFVLRALGYQSGADFQWDAAWELSDLIGMTDGRYNAGTTAFTRGDTAIISYQALSAPIKGEGRTMLDRMDGKPGLDHVLYEDRYVRIQYKGITVDDYDEEYGYTNATLKLSVWNKGGTFLDGTSCPDLWISCSDYSLEGYQSSENIYAASGAVISAGQSLDMEIGIGTEANIRDGLSDLSLLFKLAHGSYSGKDFAYNPQAGTYFDGEGFTVSRQTTAFVGKTALNGAAAGTKVPSVSAEEGSLVYSDEIMELYYGGYCGTIWYYVVNKTAQVLELECESVSILGVISNNAGPIFTHYDYQALLPYSKGYMEIAGVPDGEEGAQAGIVLKTTVGGKSYTVTVEDPYKPLSSADYTYLAGADFRSIRRDYPEAVAQYAYVYAYIDMNGDLCVLTDVRYKIISNWNQVTLHNLTKGTTVVDPVNYYRDLADRTFGYVKINYLDMATEINGYHIKMLLAMTNILETGVNNWDGAYVSAAELNQ
ncbi:MAG: S-layer homology domain-containing protein [Oscillospiraceae bacterium]